MTIIWTLGVWLLRFIELILIFILLLWLYGFLVRPRFVPYAVRYFPIRVLAPFVCWLFGIDIEVIGAENWPDTKGERGYAIVANHQSNWDIVVLASVLRDPFAVIGKIELLHIPVLGTWGKTLRCAFIDRQNLRQSYTGVMVTGTENIKNGLAMIIFPAGTRSKNNEVIDFKAGSFKMATEVGAPILPIALENIYKAKSGNFFKRTKVKVHVHPWIEKSEYETMSSFELAQKSQKLITDSLPKN